MNQYKTQVHSSWLYDLTRKLPHHQPRTRINVSIFSTFIFELWVEEEKLLGNMDLVTALAAFFHTCFVFDLKYPVVRSFVPVQFLTCLKVPFKS